MNKPHYVRLPLKNAYNVRDLGGYACRYDFDKDRNEPEIYGVTRWNRFIRADDLSFLDDEDIAFLMDYGVKTVIDLRSARELETNPDPFKVIKQVRYFNIPLMANNVDDATKVIIEDKKEFLSNFYRDLIKNEPMLIKQVLDTIAEAEEGAVLFHCTVGKDRTGVIAALLLGIAGVNTADIISNYEVTYTFNSFNPFFKNFSAGIPLEVMLSKAEYLKSAIDFVNSEYGSLNEYLKVSGISNDTLKKIKNSFIDLNSWK